MESKKQGIGGHSICGPSRYYNRVGVRKKV